MISKQLVFNYLFHAGKYLFQKYSSHPPWRLNGGPLKKRQSQKKASEFSKLPGKLCCEKNEHVSEQNQGKSIGYLDASVIQYAAAAVLQKTRVNKTFHKYTN